MQNPKIGIFGLTGCAGDQLVILNCEDELLDIIKAVDLKSFTMAQTGNEECELDIAFVDGCVAQERDLEDLKKIRKQCTLLIAIGTCAVWGGIPAMANDIEREILKKKVYGKDADFINSLAAKPLSAYVKVDFNISGCPVEKEELLKGIASLLNGDLPILNKYPVCTECKMNEYECRLVNLGELCLGPITAAGCNARCPGLGISCSGCRGPVDAANIASEVALLKERGFSAIDIKNRICRYAANVELIKEHLELLKKEK